MGRKPSGIGMYIYNFAKEIIKEPDMEIHLLSDVAYSNEMHYMKEQGAVLHCYGSVIGKNMQLMKYYRYLQKVIHEVKPDIFWEGNSLVPIKITNPYGRFMVTVHDLFPLTMPQYYGKLYEHYFRHGLKNTLKYVDTLIYNSLETQRDMERLFPKAEKKKKFISYIIVDEAEERETGDNNSFLYVGNLEKRKGTDLLLDAYLRYLELGGEKNLRFAGKIREEDIEEKIRRVQELTAKAEYLGYLTKNDKEREYSQCSAFLFPSKAEGFGMPVIEVMNYNKPIIASNLSIFEELVGDEINYFALSEDSRESAERLAEKMLDYEKPREGIYGEIIERYTPKTLSERLCAYFRREVKKDKY